MELIELMKLEWNVCVYMLGFAQLKVSSSFVYLFIVIFVF